MGNSDSIFNLIRDGKRQTTKITKQKRSKGIVHERDHGNQKLTNFGKYQEATLNIFNEEMLKKLERNAMENQIKRQM